MKTLNEFFALGMKRWIPELVEPPFMAMRAFNLGGGNSNIKDVPSLDLPRWDATRDPIPAQDNSIGALYAFHFLEHLTGAQAIALLREAERVLVPRGVFNILVPHRLGAMAFQDLDHKSFYNEDTWKELFSNPYYDKNGTPESWRLEVNVNVIIGLSERNLALMTQLVKK